MMKKVAKISYILPLILMCMMLIFAMPTYAKKYDTKLSKAQRESLCTQLKSQTLATTKNQGSLGGGVIPDNVLTNLYSTTKKISDSTSLVLTMGHVLTCHAVHAGKNSVSMMGLELFDYPDMSVWACGAIIYFIGFMMTLSITFYIVDIAFKLGFAVIMLPIGVALWPFPVTKDKLSTLISIILKNAAIFVFLSMTVSYALNLINEALTMPINPETPLDQVPNVSPNASGFEKLFALVDNNQTDLIAENFTLFSTFYLVILFSLVYGFKLIGSTIPDYVDNFFPDKAFGKASPIHHSMTQGVDFVKKKTVDPAMSFAHDVAKTQTGRAIAGVGRVMSGKYRRGDTTRSIKHSVNHFGAGLTKGASSIITGTVGRLVLGKQASQDIQNRINEKIDNQVDDWDEEIDEIADKKYADSQARKTQREQNEGKLAKTAKKVFKPIFGFAGEILEKTGTQMQRNKKTAYQIAQEKERRRLEEEEREKREKAGQETDY